MKMRVRLKWFWQALLLSALMMAPVWGQIHKTVHGLQVKNSQEQSLFSEHVEGSVVCQALDHLGTGDGLQTFDAPSCVFKTPAHLDETLLEFERSRSSLSYAARAPPSPL